jgi:hypothetical protein
MFHRSMLAAIVCLLFSPPMAWAEEAGEKVLDRFVGTWRNEISRKGPEAPEVRKLSSNEVITKVLQGRFLIGREINPDTGVKFMWFLSHDPNAKTFTWTYFNTQGLLGTEWKGTWDESTSTLTSESSDAPATWTSSAVNRFASNDAAEGKSWMKDDKGKLIFDMSVTKKRQSAKASEATLAAWSADAKPAMELSAELKALDRYAGKWDITSVAKKAEWTPEETRTKGKVERVWVLNRTILQAITKGDDGKETISLLTFDPKRSEYRGWWFASAGPMTKATGKWEKASDSIQLKSTLPIGQTRRDEEPRPTISLRYIDADHHEWQIQHTDVAGKVYFDCTVNCVRAKP